MRQPLLAATILFSLSGAYCSSERSKEPEKTAAPPAVVTSSPAAYEGIDVVEGGVINGVVKYTGAKPKVNPRPITKNQEICGHGTKPSEDILVSVGFLQNVVLTLEGIRRGKRPVSGEMPVLDQVKCDYVPHVQAVMAGTTMDVRNSDDLLHNVHGYLNGRETIFNFGMPLKDQRISKQVNRPGIIHLQCDAGHTWMSAYIVVTEHPYFAVTGTRGAFSITDIPAGTYKLKAWHEKLGTQEQEVAVAPRAKTAVSFEFK